jgi:miniconductance mechanosensitive channel
MGLIVLVFRDTILGFVASVQINSSDLLMEGDAIEMPSFGADGSVLDISLHTVKVQNWDKAITVIPTYKFLDTPYKNWRGMLEGDARRIKRSLYIDVNSIRFCDLSMMQYFRSIDLIGDYVEAQLARHRGAEAGAEWIPENPFDDPLPTNIEVFQEYALSFLKNRPDIHQQDMTLIVRQLEPGPTGLPLEIYAFTKTVDLAEYEAIQARIFDHLLAAMPQFGLQIFQQPTGADFRVITGAQ